MGGSKPDGEGWTGACSYCDVRDAYPSRLQSSFLRNYTGQDGG